MLDATQTTLYPVGILNTGFALNWAKERVHDAQPAGPRPGSPGEPEDPERRQTEGQPGPARGGGEPPGQGPGQQPLRGEGADPLAPITFVDKIDVPTYMACQWTDEQTGGHCPTLAEHFTGTRRKWFTFTNGTHVDSLDPETFNRLYDFL